MEKTEFLAFVGTYTKKASEGIYSFRFDTKEEKIKDIKLATKQGSPTYLAISEDNQYLYSVATGNERGGVAAYKINAKTGELNLINEALQEGSSPCYVHTDSKLQTVVTAYYHKGKVEAHLINKDKGVSPVVSTVEHHGSGPNPERQEKAHTHYANFTPDEKYVVVVDLGIDQVITYSVNDGNLAEVSKLSLRPGSGPRHLAFHPNGKFAYVMTELSNEIVALAYNADEGSFTEIQYEPTIPADFTENSQGSAIHVTKDGRFVYVSNRGHDSIAAFAIDQKSGKVEFLQHISTEGHWPRDFVLDPTENYLICANERTDNLTLYKRDKETGKLSLLEKGISVPEPVCVKFLHV